MKNSNPLKLVRGFGIYHAFAIAPLVFPFISEKVFELLGSLYAYLNLSGEWGTTNAADMLFVTYLPVLRSCGRLSVSHSRVVYWASLKVGACF